MWLKNFNSSRSKIITRQQPSLSASVVAMMLLFPAVSQATNGYFAHGYGARSKAMGGVGAAFPQDAMAAAVNPAGMVFVGNRLDVEIELFSPRREYSVQGTPTMAQGAFPLNSGTVDSGSNYFPIPTIGLNYKLDDNQSIGLTIFGNGGMNTNYPDFFSQTCPIGGSGTFCAGRTGIDLAQAFISPSYAHSFANNKVSVGIAPIFAVQSFKARGLNSFGAFSSDPQHLSDLGRDYSYGGGVRVGGLVEILPRLHLGASYKSRIFMTPFNDYAGLFAEQGDFDIPESINAGLAWDINDSITAAFDVEHIRYSSIKSVHNPLLPNLQTAQLGNNQGAGFGWKDMTVFKLGTQWKQNKNWTWRAGVSYGEQPIPKSQVLFNVLAPGVQEWHLTTGFSRTLSDKDDLSFAFMYSPNKTVSGANPLSPSQTIDLQMYQLSFQLAWSRRF
ncbi:MAG: outer membrane protein transport protein [Methylococcaceae bacterium]|nr:outer membrane protein transport protein [Methylococcaceae bacterium]